MESSRTWLISIIRARRTGEITRRARAHIRPHVERNTNSLTQSTGSRQEGYGKSKLSPDITSPDLANYYQ